MTDDRLPFDLPEVPPVQDSRARAIRRRRNLFRTHPTPTQPMSRPRRAWTPGRNLSQSAPEDLVTIISWFEDQPDGRERFRWALRDSLDELLDGQRTGRWAYQHLSKTEKTYLGTAIEVNLTKEFEIANGDDLDWQVGGVDLDCKFSRELGGWEIPMEMYLCAAHGERSGKDDHPALVVWMNDDTNEWAAGFVRITDSLLRWRDDQASGSLVRAYNRDNKRRIAEAHAGLIYWLWGGLQTDLPMNLLLHLDPAARERIFAAHGQRRSMGGQARTDQLFREVQRRIIGRQTVQTVAQQDDAPKRARDSRLRLRDEGIIVLGHQESHPHVARALDLPVPAKGEWVATRVKRVRSASRGPSFELRGEAWAIADPNDPVESAPALPRALDLFWFRGASVEYRYGYGDEGGDPVSGPQSPTRRPSQDDQQPD